MNMVILLRWISARASAKEACLEAYATQSLPRRQLLLSSCRFPTKRKCRKFQHCKKRKHVKRWYCLRPYRVFLWFLLSPLSFTAWKRYKGILDFYQCCKRCRHWRFLLWKSKSVLPEWWRRCFCYLFVIYPIRPLCWQHLFGPWGRCFFRGYPNTIPLRHRLAHLFFYKRNRKVRSLIPCRHRFTGIQHEYWRCIRAVFRWDLSVHY